MVMVMAKKLDKVMVMVMVMEKSQIPLPLLFKKNFEYLKKN